METEVQLALLDLANAILKLRRAAVDQKARGKLTKSATILAWVTILADVSKHLNKMVQKRKPKVA